MCKWICLIVTVLSSSTLVLSAEAAPSPVSSATQTPQAELPKRDEVPELVGHNVSSTAYSLKKGQKALGTYFCGYGFEDWFSVSTSPWMLIQYNMPMINAKVGVQLTPEDRVALEAMYFKTFHYGFDMYDMEATFERASYSHYFGKNYTIHASVGFQYFFSEASPYSLRRITGNGDPHTISIGSLHEIKFDRNRGLLLEAAVLGANYKDPYLHLGASFFYRWKAGYVQLGFSQSRAVIHYNEKVLNDADPTHPVFITSWVDTALHPEVQVQFFLD